MSPDTSPTTASPSGETSRRRLLALLGAGGAAGLATLISRDEARAGHDGTNVFHLGQSNTNPPGATTGLHANGNAALTIFGRLDVGGSGSGEGPRLRVFGTPDPGDSDPAMDVSSSFVAVNGAAAHPDGAGVQGTGAAYDSPPGAGTGVRGLSGTGMGVHGIAVGAGTGVEARCGAWDPSAPGGGPPSLEGHALAVSGRSAFSTVGSAVIPAGAESVFVPNAAVTADSHITVTLTSNPGERQIRWVERSNGTGFTVHLTPAPKKHRPATGLTYMIVEPGGVGPIGRASLPADYA